MGSLHLVAQTAFDDLLARWRSHHALTCRNDVSVPRLSDSRRKLDIARNRMHALRAAMYPTRSERQEVLATVLCCALDEVVHLNWTRRDPADPTRLQCICGESVALA